MADLREHFENDFLGTDIEYLDKPHTSVALNGQEVKLVVRFHHDSRNRLSFVSIQRPTNLSAQQLDEFHNSIPALRQECKNKSSVSHSPSFELSNRIYVYTDEPQAQQEGILPVGELSVIRRGPSYCQQMEATETLIKAYINEYEQTDRDYYQRIATLVRSSVEDKLKEAQILGIVSDRAKEAGRLEKKLRQRAFPLEHAEASYLQRDDILSDLIDLAGVRVALYFPGDRGSAAEQICSLFDEYKPKKEFPEGQRNNKGDVRFSGYRATHLRLQVPGDLIGVQNRLFPVEIQIASVIMHAWSEVEHDLDYKQLQGPISSLELQLLDQLNGLALAGEISLEQLQIARNDRLAKTTEQFI